MPCRPLLQHVNKTLLKIPAYKICHLSPFSANWMMAMIGIMWQIFLCWGLKTQHIYWPSTCARAASAWGNQRIMSMAQ